MANIALAIHGGAGTILQIADDAGTRTRIPDGLRNGLNGWLDDLERRQRRSTRSRRGYLARRFSAVQRGPRFGLYHEGKNEMDASIMDGRRSAGRCGRLRQEMSKIRSNFARLVMERTPAHPARGRRCQTSLPKRSASNIADRTNISLPNTAGDSSSLKHAIKADKITLDHAAPNSPQRHRKPIGTVGAVACDQTDNSPPRHRPAE